MNGPPTTVATIKAGWGELSKNPKGFTGYFKSKEGKLNEDTNPSASFICLSSHMGQPNDQRLGHSAKNKILSCGLSCYDQNAY